MLLDVLVFLTFTVIVLMNRPNRNDQPELPLDIPVEYDFTDRPRPPLELTMWDVRYIMVEALKLIAAILAARDADSERVRRALQRLSPGRPIVVEWFERPGWRAMSCVAPNAASLKNPVPLPSGRTIRATDGLLVATHLSDPDTNVRSKVSLYIAPDLDSRIMVIFFPPHVRIDYDEDATDEQADASAA